MHVLHGMYTERHDPLLLDSRSA